MCARFTIRRNLEQLAHQWQALFGPGLERFLPRYNIAPTQPVPVLADDERGRPVLRHMRWGLIPHWTKDPALSAPLINARLETARFKPAFRDAFRYRRCLLPADGFYEWATGPKGQRLPYFIHQPDDALWAFAGLWEHWQDPNGNELESCTLLTTAANDLLRPLHDRMPVILEPRHALAWLHAPSPDDALAALTQHPPPPLTLHRVSPRVNRPTLNDPSCTAPLPPEPQAELF